VLGTHTIYLVFVGEPFDTKDIMTVSLPSQRTNKQNQTTQKNTQMTKWTETASASSLWLETVLLFLMQLAVQTSVEKLRDTTWSVFCCGRYSWFGQTHTG